jgi:hypothetical protein
LRFGSDACAAASGVGNEGALELRIEFEQGPGLERVIHSLTQLAHMVSTGAVGGSAQVVHTAGQPGARGVAAVGRRRSMQAEVSQ